MEIGRSRAQWGSWLVIVAGIVVGVRISGSASGDVGGALGGPIRLVVLLLPAAVVLTSLHEAAHAVVGRLVGWRVFGVTIGQGRRHATVRVGSVRVELRGVLVGGVTIARPTGRRAPDVAMLVAGVTLEAIVIVLALAWSPESAWAQSARWALVFVACIDIAANLWPRRVDVGPMSGMATDGAQLVGVITTPDEWRRDLEQMRWTPERAELMQSLHGGDVELRRCLASVGGAEREPHRRVRVPRRAVATGQDGRAAGGRVEHDAHNGSFVVVEEHDALE